MSETTSGPVGVRPRSAPVVALRVLLVEDDDGDALLVHELLLDAAADVDLQRVHTIAEAVSELATGFFDCALLDLGLPDADRLGALHTILDAAPNLAVLVLTGLADEFRGTEAVAFGAQDYLVKGSTDGELLRRAIRYAVERKRADESVRRLYESELRAAENARIERGLLPPPLVSGRGVQVASRYTPGRHQSLLGGDFYDVVECDDGTLFVLIGDVAGHGPDAAAVGVCLRIAWRTLVLAGVDPERILSSVAAVLDCERDSPEIFATVTMVRVDVSRRRARFWIAGHPLPVLVRGERVEVAEIATTGVALGIVDDATWAGTDVSVDADTQMLLYTDGLIEGFADPDRSTRLGDEAMHGILRELLAQGSRGPQLVERLLRDVRTCNGDELPDDVAILLVSWDGKFAG